MDAPLIKKRGSVIAGMGDSKPRYSPIGKPHVASTLRLTKEGFQVEVEVKSIRTGQNNALTSRWREVFSDPVDWQTPFGLLNPQGGAGCSAGSQTPWFSEEGATQGRGQLFALKASPPLKVSLSVPQ